MRAATADEIKQAARRQLIADGPAAISIRAVAREVGLTPAALYRYFPSLEALIERLCADTYDELAEAIAAARDAVPGDDPAGRLRAAAWAFRDWSVAHPREFTLVFGTPVPGQAEFDPESAVHESGLRFGGAFLEAFLALWHARERGPREANADLDRRIAAAACAPFDAGGDLAMPPEAYRLYLSGWIRLYGSVALEVFGHLRWAVSDVEPLFESELNDFLDELA